MISAHDDMCPHDDDDDDGCIDWWWAGSVPPTTARILSGHQTANATAAEPIIVYIIS